MLEDVYSTFLMHLLASGPSPRWGFCATLDSPVGLCSEAQISL